MHVCVRHVCVCVIVQVTSELATIVVTEPLIMSVESVVQRTQVMVEMCADPRLVTADTGVS